MVGHTRKTDDLHVVLLGRPYTVLTAAMHKGIPNILAALGIKTFFQDMLSWDQEDVESMGALCNELRWHYAAEIMKSARFIARSEGAYPVYVTSFKCSPDSFAVEYFKKLMEMAHYILLIKICKYAHEVDLSQIHLQCPKIYVI